MLFKFSQCEICVYCHWNSLSYAIILPIHIEGIAHFVFVQSEHSAADILQKEYKLLLWY